MRQYAKIMIDRAAVHVVAPKRAQLLQSSAEVHLDDGVRTFLTQHISRGLTDSNAIAARFKVTGADRAEGVCRSIEASGHSFVARSGTLAKLLYDASGKDAKTDARVSDGTLVVARCSADDAGTTVRFVALLKLDPSDAYRAEEGVEAGKPVVRLVAQPNTLPSPRERLQKAAFVRATGKVYDALAVDNQRRGAVVADFFLDSFLGLEHASDDVERTRELYRTLKHTFDDQKGNLTAGEYAQLDTFIRGAMSSGHIDVDAITQSLPAPAPVKQEFTAKLDAIVDRQFDTDPDTVQELLQVRRFKGDHGLRVSARSDNFDDMVTVQPPSDGTDEYVITIRTKEWSER